MEEKSLPGLSLFEIISLDKQFVDKLSQKVDYIFVN